ncbi:G-type lectin S-receptor-like serine/threonine-protein kinase At5g35370 [Prosopis cineraria]|uniref:G-type lectin S-receptor-like serine/threonine-protein kinase At5g35370 n=1 Tax=Prosopis cineraria TaxID=364024 RepID=UPI00240EFD3A|nr:G-type lectin S-receptor-like serine/threonine-protein kinase At5g35370 [Prosopis cineraria]
MEPISSYSLFCISSNFVMESVFYFSLTSLLFSSISAYTFSESINPNFTASYLQFIDRSGTFLTSRNGTFEAAIFNPGDQQSRFYFCVFHVASHTIIWSANREAPISNSDTMNLTTKGITIFDHDGSLKWSTPPLKSAVSALQLTETGNLVLLDHSNGSLWESFQHPTDTIVIGQRLPVRTWLSSAISGSDLSTGDYNLSITPSDAILQWHGQTYWRLSMAKNAFKDSNYMVEYMAINRTALDLFGSNGTVTVFRVVLPMADFRIAKLAVNGQFTVQSFSGTNWVQEFVGPDDGCDTPFICGRLGLCTHGTASSAPTCSCPSNFNAGSSNVRGCVPSNASYSLPFACKSSGYDSTSNSSAVSYLKLGNGMEYFSNTYSNTVTYVENSTICQDLCSWNCSCLGFFYENTTGSCSMLENELGSILSGSGGTSNSSGYIKVVVESATDIDDPTSEEEGLPVAVLVLIPLTGFIIALALGFLWLRRYRISKGEEIKLGKFKSHSSEDLEAFHIPGLPKRFDYEELVEATDGFKTLIGSGGFGAVFKGQLPDKTVVAVKKIVNLGNQGKKDFCTEIAIIGNIHHVNLVKLKGFCAEGRQRLLIYEYMNRGSLDRTLFGGGPVLEWQERVDIALGTARGLAYLHGGCEQKIIHCDIKPENILLHDHFQAKISDFGLSKLLSPEQSGLFTTMRGTRGYLAPEWLTNSAITEKTDVYSFGMVLLELVSGRKNCSVGSQSPSKDESSSCRSGTSSVTGLVYFPLFALEMHEQGRYLELADPRLEGRVSNDEVEKLVRIALCCVHEEPALRPNMAAVVGMLEGGTPMAQPRIESLNFLRFYGRTFTEASMLAEEKPAYQQAQKHSATTSGSQTAFSYVSSHDISGPR